MTQRDILIGTSGYSYPGPPPKGWFGAFYPDVKSKGFDELKYYSNVFNTVEINTTFYRPPSEAMTKRWASKTPFGLHVRCKTMAEIHAPDEDFSEEVR